MTIKLNCRSVFSAQSSLKLGYRVSRVWVAAVIAIGSASTAMAAGPVTQTDLVGPAGSGTFGSTVTVLPNGNIVVTDPSFDAPSATDSGAVYLYDGATHNLISVLTGQSTGDQIGNLGVVVLSNGNYVVLSSLWDGAGADAGAATWGSGVSGVSGTVSSANSLVGGSANDHVSAGGIVALANSNYIVHSPDWDGATASEAGAVTWGNGLTGTVGVVGSSNSLVGSHPNDRVGAIPAMALSNGNFVVVAPDWDNGNIADAGAVTWGNGNTGIAGAITAANSLVGGTANDQVGSSGVVASRHGTYMVSSPKVDRGGQVDVGAATWGSTSGGIHGVVGPDISLMGSTAGDQIGNGGIFTLASGNYVVSSPNWDRFGRADVGAVTWVRETTGIVSEINPSNSLVGDSTDDQIGGNGIILLTNGNYVVRSVNWDNGSTVDVGAATWGSGTSGVAGVVSVDNSLIGTKASDQIGSSGIVILTGGNYVVRSNNWDNGHLTNVGAVTWGDGNTGITGTVNSANSLIGATAGDHVGFSGVTVLANGNYVVRSEDWDNGSVIDAGAVTWGNGNTGITGTVNLDNSLVGSTTGDDAGSSNVITLTNGNFVLRSPNWDNGLIVDAGAATWGDGDTGITGTISAENSLVGTSTDDHLGSTGLTALTNGGYVVRSANWDNQLVTNAGAVTWGSPTAGVTGTINSSNSLVGSHISDTVGSTGVVALPNGNYVVRSQLWNNGNVLDAGAVTWGNGKTGITGEVSISNSIAGSRGSDGVGTELTILPDGSYVLRTKAWNNGTTVDAGAVTWGNDNSSTTGPINSSNSVLGQTAVGGAGLNFAYSLPHQYLVVGRPADNKVTLFGQFGPEILVSGQGQAIASGESLPTPMSGTDFGDVGIHAAQVTHTFTISNVGNAGLLLDSPVIDNPAFTITTHPAPLVASGDATQFDITVDPSIGGLLTATVSISNSDAFTNPFTFVVQVTGTIQRYTLNTVATGTGSGVIALDPPGGIYDEGTVVTVTATPAAGSLLMGWNTAADTTCLGNITPCTVLMAKSTVLTAIFDLLPDGQDNLTVIKAGTGLGSVTSDPAGIDCGLTCSVGVLHNTVVTLTANAAQGSTFTGWIGSPSCGSAITCVVAMNGSQLITATFSLNQYALSVTRMGAGQGVVVSDPAGIDCGSTCSANFNFGTEVTLTANANANSNLTGWTGAPNCSTSSTCKISMTEARHVVASFTLNIGLNQLLYLPMALD